MWRKRAGDGGRGGGRERKSERFEAERDKDVLYSRRPTLLSKMTNEVDIENDWSSEL